MIVFSIFGISSSSRYSNYLPILDGILFQSDESRFIHGSFLLFEDVKKYVRDFQYYVSSPDFLEENS